MEEKKASLNFLLESQVREFFLHPTHFTEDLDILQNQKFLSQIYDSIIRLYEVKKQESYFPTETELYDDLEFRKKAISDTSLLPSRTEIYKYYFMLACHKPAFLLLLRELRFGSEEKFFFITKFAIPYQNKMFLIQKGISQVLHNSLVNFRNHVNEINPTNRLKQKIQNFRSLEELENIIETGQIHIILKKIYFYKNQFQNPSQQDIFRMNLVNQRIKEMILKPLTQQLLREKLIVAVKRNIANQILPDVLLINNIYHIELRYNLLMDLIHHEIVKSKIWGQLDTETKILIESKNRIEQALEISKKILENPGLPKGLLLLATEIISLHEFIKIQKKQEQLEKDKMELQTLIKKLSRQEGVYRVKNKDKIYTSQRIIEYILKGKVPSILFATMPIFSKTKTSIDHYNEIYILLNEKKKIASAIEQAKELFEKVHDVYLIRILEQMFDYHNKSKEELNQLIPSYIREEFHELLSQSYLQDIPFFKRILYKLLNETLTPQTLRQLWQKYYDKHKLLSIGSSTSSHISKSKKKRKKEEKQETTLISASEIESEDNFQNDELYKKLLQKIEWYLERDKIPTENILYHDFNTQKAKLENIFELASLGSRSVQDIISISTNENVYIITRSFLEKNKDTLLKKYQNKLQEIQGIQTKEGKIISLTTEKDKKELYEKLIQKLKNI